MLVGEMYCASRGGGIGAGEVHFKKKKKETFPLS